MERNWTSLLLHYVPERWRSKAVVAGGFAADPARARDVDIWIPADNRYHEARTDVRNHLRKLGLEYTLEIEHSTTDDEERAEDYAHHLVATIPNGFGNRPVQILVSDAVNAQQLVEGFDISTHAIAKSLQPGTGGAMRVTFAARWTGTRVPPRVMRWTTPEDTLRRLQRVMLRYGVAADKGDLERLEQLVFAQLVAGEQEKVAA